MIGFTIDFFDKKSKLSRFFFGFGIGLAFLNFFLKYIDPLITSIFALIAKNPIEGIWWSSYTGFMIFGFWLKFIKPESRFGNCMFVFFVWLVCIFLPFVLLEYDDLKLWLSQSEYTNIVVFAYSLGVGYLTIKSFESILYYLFENKSSRKNPENPRITRSKD